MLRLTPSDGWIGEVVRRESVVGIIDVAEGGRLAGVEVAGLSRSILSTWLNRAGNSDSLTVADDGTAYFVISDGDDRNVRSVNIAVSVESGRNDELLSLAIPRRGAGYEISYPSGKQ